MKYTRKKK